MLQRASRRFRLLSEPSRLQVLNLLHVRGELTVQEIVAETGLGQANVSKHLGAMAREGLVARRQNGLFAHYSIADPSISALCLLVCSQLRAEREVQER